MILPKLTDKQALYVVCCGLIVFLVLLGYLIGSTGQEDCEPLRLERDALKVRVAEMEEDNIRMIQSIEERIKATQIKICRSQIERFKKEYKSLYCKICDKKGINQ